MLLVNLKQTKGGKKSEYAAKVQEINSMKTLFEQTLGSISSEFINEYDKESSVYIYGL